MKFPYTPTTNLEHQFGGRIVLVHGIKHQAVPPRDGRSLDCWWFDCDVIWDDGKQSRSPVDPFKMVAEDGGTNPDIKALSAEMMDYLHEHGTWHETGRHRGWYAHRKAKTAV